MQILTSAAQAVEGFQFGASEWIALGAVVVAGLSWLWQLIRAWRWERPIVSVFGHVIRSYNTQGAPTGDLQVTINVVNVGAVSTALVDVYWQIERADGELIYVGGDLTTDEDERVQHPGLVAHYAGKTDPPLPYVLERNGVVAWEYQADRWDLGLWLQAARARAVVVYVDRPRRARKGAPLQPVTRQAVSAWDELEAETGEE